jgi:hypothetical protein
MIENIFFIRIMQQTELFSAVQDRQVDIFLICFPFKFETEMKLYEERKRG